MVSIIIVSPFWVQGGILQTKIPVCVKSNTPPAVINALRAPPCKEGFGFYDGSPLRGGRISARERKVGPLKNVRGVLMSSLTIPHEWPRAFKMTGSMRHKWRDCRWYFLIKTSDTAPASASIHLRTSAPERVKMELATPKEAHNGRQGRQKRQGQRPETEGDQTGKRSTRKARQTTKKHKEIGSRI